MDGFTFEDCREEEIRAKSVARSNSNVDTKICPPGCMLNKKFVSGFQQIRDFTVYHDDVWVVSFPKCGTTWTQEMVWLLRNNLDYEKAKTTVLRERFPFLELELIIDHIEDEKTYPKTVDLAASSPRPRCIKSHLPPELLPTQIWTVKPKMVYVSRNPRDAVVSYYHHHRLWNGYVGTFEEFFKVFIADKVVYAPYWTHFLSYMKKRGTDHMLFNSYEEMKRDLAGVVRKTAEFLEVQLNEEQVLELCQHLSFDSMKTNASVNYMDVGDEVLKQTKIGDPQLKFMRSGELGGWRKVFTQEMIEQMDEWTKRHLAGTEFTDYPS